MKWIKKKKSKFKKRKLKNKKLILKQKMLNKTLLQVNLRKRYNSFSYLKMHPAKNDFQMIVLKQMKRKQSPL